MRFSELLKVAGLTPGRRRGDAEVTDVSCDSRTCAAGSCFIAVRGPADDGHRYIASAVAAGSVAVVCQHGQAVPAGVAVAVVDDTREALGPIAQAMRGWPGRKLVNIGITGTNGKSTVAFLLRSAIAAASPGVPAPALVGTIFYDTGRRMIPARVTTPSPVELAEFTEEMVSAGKTHLIMEVSSHALDQRRTEGIDFRTAIFTNLSGDHLDYHRSMEDYLAAKLRLFAGLSADSTAVINRDSPAGEAVAAATKAKVLWYGLSSAADLRARIDRIDAGGSRFTLIGGPDEVPVASRLIGRHNVFNCLAAAAAAMTEGMDLQTVAGALEAVESIPGRLERVAVDAAYEVFVDYAHTDDALFNVLSSLRPITRGEIILVFGCGGDRDRSKRPRMARVAERLADRIVVTSDNPRGEDPDAIIADITAGLSEAGLQKTEVHPDRGRAIELAVARARPGDVVLIAGKGHEKYQITGDRRVHFDDVETAAECVHRREDAT